MARWHAHKTITQIYEADGRKKTSERNYRNLCRLYQENFRAANSRSTKYGPFRRPDSEEVPSHMQETLEAPITEEELWTALKQGALSKSPGEDGIWHEFYLAHWETLKRDLLQIYNSYCRKEAWAPLKEQES
jgi:serine/threonine protein phosphatase PrpC